MKITNLLSFDFCLLGAKSFVWREDPGQDLEFFFAQDPIFLIAWRVQIRARNVAASVVFG